VRVLDEEDEAKFLQQGALGAGEGPLHKPEAVPPGVDRDTLRHRLPHPALLHVVPHVDEILDPEGGTAIAVVPTWRALLALRREEEGRHRTDLHVELFEGNLVVEAVEEDLTRSRSNLRHFQEDAALLDELAPAGVGLGVRKDSVTTNHKKESGPTRKFAAGSHPLRSLRLPCEPQQGVRPGIREATLSRKEALELLRPSGCCAVLWRSHDLTVHV
jgi:hypothetical protein